MTHRPTAVFDLDGTLIDTAPDLVDAVNAVLAVDRLGRVDRATLNHLVGQGGRAMIRAAYAHFDHEIEETKIDRLIPVFIETYRSSMPGQSRPYEGVIELVEALIAKDWLCAVCTNKMKVLADPLLETLNINHLFAHVSGGDSYPFKKPDPRHIEQTVRDAGGDPSRAIMFGDSENDIVAAQAANIPVIAVDFGYTPVHVSTFQPDRIVSAYSQMSADDLDVFLDQD